MGVLVCRYFSRTDVRRHVLRSGVVEIESRHLRAFLAVAEALNFTRAAERLGLPQPALSAQIKRLERGLGETLFERTTRSVRLTAVGEALVPRARAAVSALEAVKAELLDGAAAGVSLATEDHMPSLAELAAQRLSPAPSYAVIDQPLALPAVRSRELDAFLGWDYPVHPVKQDASLDVAAICHDRLCAYLPPDHPLAGQQSLPLSALRSERWVVRPAPSPHREALVRYCALSGFVPEIAFTSSDSHFALRLLRDGTAITYGSPLSSPHLGFAVVPFEEELTQRLVLVTHVDLPSEPREALRDLCTEWRKNIERDRLTRLPRLQMVSPARATGPDTTTRAAGSP